MGRTRTKNFNVLNPALALASSRLRKIWDSKGLSLEDMAAEINQQFGERVCDRDSLARFLWAGTNINKGLMRVAAFNKMLLLTSDYFEINREDLKKEMDAEVLRQNFLAELGLEDIPTKKLISALEARKHVDRKQATKIGKWLKGDSIDNELYRLLPDAIAALEFVTGNDYSETLLMEWKNSISSED